MSSKTILIGLSTFRFAGEKSVQERPSWELAPYDCSSQKTASEDFAAWCKLVSKECRFNDRAGKCGVVRLTDLQHNFFILVKAKALPIQILNRNRVKQCDLHDNGRNTIKGGSQETKGQKRTGGGRTGYGKREIMTPLLPPPPAHFSV